MTMYALLHQKQKKAKYLSLIVAEIAIKIIRILDNASDERIMTVIMNHWQLMQSVKVMSYVGVERSIFNLSLEVMKF